MGNLIVTDGSYVKPADAKAWWLVESNEGFMEITSTRQATRAMTVAFKITIRMVVCFDFLLEMAHYLKTLQKSYNA